MVWSEGGSYIRENSTLLNRLIGRQLFCSALGNHHRLSSGGDSTHVTLFNTRNSRFI